MEKLPVRVPYLRSARAAQPSLKREIEIRILRGGTPEELTHYFFDELNELALLDHPGFLPVLNDMSLEGRPCYTVPMREHEDLGSLVGQDDFTLEDRCQAVRSLASALAALHARDILLGPLPPELVAWDPEAARVYLRHHKAVPEHWERGLLRHTPLEAEDAQEAHDKRGDVFYWGVLSFWLISRGQHAYGAGPEDLRPLRGLVPDLAESFANVIEAACAWDPELRPEAAPELCSVLLLDATNVAKGQAAPGDTVDIEKVASQVMAKVRDVRSSGRMPIFQPPELKEPETDDAMLRSDDSLMGVPGDLARLAAEARKRGLQPEPEPFAPAALLPRLGLVALLLIGLVLGFYLSTGHLPQIPWERIGEFARSMAEPDRSTTPEPTGGTDRPPPPTTSKTEPKAPPLPSGPLPEGLDPGLRELLSHQGDVLPEDFQRLWNKMRDLTVAKKLPRKHLDETRLKKLLFTYKRNKKRGARKLQTWMEQIHRDVR